MNSDKIILPAFLIADLYKDSLVDIDTSAESINALPEQNNTTDAKPYATPDKITFLGENLKNVTIVVNQPASAFLNDEDLAFLTNILKACQLNIADIAIVNIAAQPTTYTALKEQLSSQQIVLFDVEPSFIKLPFIIPPFQVQTFGDTTIMMAPALAVLNKPNNEGRLLKTKLWNGLKQVFAIG